MADLRQLDPYYQARLWFTIGAPGSGKSTWAGCMPHPVITTDALRGVGGEQENRQSAIREIYQWAFVEVLQALSHGRSVVLETCGANLRIRREAIEMAKSCHSEVVAVVFQADLEACQEVQKSRRHPVPREQVEQMHRTIRGLTDERLLAEGFHQVLHIHREQAPWDGPPEAQEAPRSHP